MKKYLVLGSIISAVLVLGGGAAYMAFAQTSSTQVTACARANGDIYLIGPSFSRQTCQGQHVEVSWPTLVGTPRKLNYYDANNNYIGEVISSGRLFVSNNFEYVAYNKDIGVFLAYYPDGLNSGSFTFNPFEFQGSSEFHFANQGCEGDVYAGPGQYVDSNQVFRVLGHGYTGLYRGATGTESFTEKSRVINGGCENVATSTVQGYRLIPIELPQYLLSPTPPLRVVSEQF